MKILYVQPGPGIGGSKISLYHLLKSAPNDQESIVALSSPAETHYEQEIKEFTKRIIYLSLPTWEKFRKRGITGALRTPFSNVRRLLGLIPSVIKLSQIIKQEQIDLVHTNNSICPVGAFAACLTKRPHIWHIREAIGSKGHYHFILGDWLSFLIIRKLSNVIVCNSEYTKGFFEKSITNIRIVRNGLDINAFKRGEQRGQLLKKTTYWE